MSIEKRSITDVRNPTFLRRLRTIQSHAGDAERTILESNVYCLFEDTDPTISLQEYDAVIWANMVLTQQAVLDLSSVNGNGKYLQIEDEPAMQATSWGLRRVHQGDAS